MAQVQTSTSDVSAPAETPADTISEALRLHRAGKLRQAHSLYCCVLSTQPNNADALSRMGLLLHQTGQNAAAVKILHRAIEARPDHAETLATLGCALLAMDETASAVSHLERAVALKPGFVSAHNSLGRALADAGRLNEAIAAFERAIVLDPRHAEAHYNLANALKEQGKLAEAEDGFLRALKVDPEYLEACIPLSAVQESLGKPEQARDTLNRGIRNRPFYSDFCKDKPLGSVLIFMGVQDCGFDLSDDHRHKISGGHFSTAEFIKNDRFTRHVFYILDDNLEKMAGKLPGHDIIINTIACPDREHVSLESLSRFLGGSPHTPLINHPDEVLKTTRDNNHSRLKRLKGITFPKTIRLSAKDAGSGDLAALIRKKRLSPPFIIRRTGTQTAVSTRLLESFDELGGYLAETKGDTYYIIEFVECPYKKKYFRK